jgi:twitching motility two-component system response regulator PilH
MHHPLIAIVEDDPVVNELLGEMLIEEGYRTLVWPCGKDAHLQVRAARPDLVILDIWLEHPESGLTVLDLLERDHTTRRIPVIVCSAHITELRRQEERLRRQGHAIIEKPFGIDELLATIRAMLPRDTVPSA